MRLVGVVLALVLASSTAYADKMPFEVVRVLPETGQVLVFDRPNNTHVLLKPGEVFRDYSIVEISGIGMIVEKDQKRTAMYPLGAQGIVLNLQHTDDQVQPVFGKSSQPPPSPAPAPVVASVPVFVKSEMKTEAKSARVAIELASLLTAAPPRLARLK